MSPTKAVIFTHIQMDWDTADAFGDAQAVMKQINERVEYFKSYLKCSNVGLVYGYVDLGSRLLARQVEALKSGSEVQFGLRDLHVEQRARNVLKLAVDEAQRELSAKERSTAPRFQFVGLPHLSSLFYSLYRINPRLIEELSGPQGRLTYDAPKFVDAVIRLARGADLIQGGYPVLRFDADVKVNESGVARLLRAVSRGRVAGQPYDFFSGGYGREDGVPDPVNDYAVRVHWVSHPAGGGLWTLDPRWEVFLRDLGEFGASQVPSSCSRSGAADALVADPKRGGISANRASQQVISGAGLYMSLPAIQQLPPFMNFANMTTWIDDHLKRRLHEAVGHLQPSALEHEVAARFEQNRHPSGIHADDIQWAQQKYFERLFRGCLLHALIVRPDGTRGPLAREVRTVLQTFVLNVADVALATDFLPVVLAAANDVLGVWTTADYGSDHLKTWAASISPAQRVDICQTVVDDAIRYLHLVELWPQYVRAIQQLVPAKAHWLFRTAD